ncbi:unnamed protein product [Oppiella nova]|uniref:LRAT domain-containing protein n=1 Tax=Oppiella nova TaxID=334625 RepID=A0A7R9M9A4_9ACAR|nr:unnamed protein product [Oppiella nova]CAG2172881.1 unnamed protein product [Oppiella nova]
MGSSLSKCGKCGSNVGSFLTYDEIKQVVKRGDLIEIQRTWWLKHWVICESKTDQGIIWCYHVTPEARKDKKVVYVRYQSLLEILCNDPEEDIVAAQEWEGDEELAATNVADGVKGRDLCRVNNQEGVAKRFGVTARPLDLVFNELNTLKDKRVVYELNRRNCECYCTKWKYGKGWSEQVNKVELAIRWATLGVRVCLKFVTNPLVLSVGFVLLLSLMVYFGVQEMCPDRAIGINETFKQYGHHIKSTIVETVKQLSKLF